MTQDMERDYTELRDTYDKVVAERDAARKHLNSEYHARKAAERREAAAVGALRKFVAHYPMGVNPFLDDAFREARSVLQAVEGGEKEQGSSVAESAASDASHPDCSTAQHSAGWRLVPVEPTERMVTAYITAIRSRERVRLRDLGNHDWYVQHTRKCGERWKAMLAAAPPPPPPPLPENTTLSPRPVEGEDGSEHRDEPLTQEPKTNG